MPAKCTRPAVDLRLDEVHRRRADERGHEQVARAVEEVLRRVDLLQHAVAHDGHPLAERHRLDLVVRHVDGRDPEPLVQPRELGAHRDAQLGVEVRQRLVHQERLRLAHDRAAHRHALALAARQRATGLRSSSSSSPSLPAMSRTRRVALALVHPPQLEPVGEVVGHRHVRVERVVLEHHRDVALLRRLLRDVGVADPDRARRVTSSSPAIERRSVVLPQPDGPTSTMNSPSAMSRLTSSTACDAVRVALGDVLQADAAHPLLAPSVRPLMKCRWSTAKTISVGSAASIAPGRDQVVVGEEDALEVVQRRRDRPLVTRLDQHDRPQEVVVDPRELERGQRRQRRPAERQDDPEELAHDARAVDPRRVAERLRDRLHVVREHERAEAGLERDVDRDQPDDRVVHLARSRS